MTLRNILVAYVPGRERINLKITSRKVLTLLNAQHVPGVRKNLISGSFFIQCGYKIGLEATCL